jgi:2'-hydroxyisoflavone reductase
MKALILGGTVFLGRAVVEAALAGGHEVSLFNRGNHPQVFPELEQLRGDRDGALEALEGRRWDVVIDPSGYVPRVVRASAALLAEAAEHYTFISSVSVYRDFTTPGMDETAPVGTLADESVEEVGPNYGPLKALCESAAEEAFGAGRVLNVRAGLIVGPHDPTDRFTYWPSRVARGGDVLAPGSPGRQVQVIDVRDLAEWVVRMAEERLGGTFNATGPEGGLTMGRLLAACKSESGSDARFVWVDGTFVIEQGVTPWTEMPLWVPDTPEYAGFMSVDCRRAYAAGLRSRRIEETVRATLGWDAERPADAPLRAGLSAERETTLLRAWRERSE